MKFTTPMFLLAVCVALVPLVAASSNGMDMSMDSSMNLAQGEMLPYLHFTPGDTLWFLGWVPSSSGAMVGACIGLFLLAMIERWIAAGRAVMELHWRRSARVAMQEKNAAGLPVAYSSSDSKSPSTAVSIASLPDRTTLRTFPPFIFAHDFPRGVVYMAQSLLNFSFMLAVMTFQLGFIFALIVGLGVGEMLFGRYTSHSALHLV
ncbi:hypothetical protein IEO21_03736 [Rhodonia placenta]|uniref:Copper transport protein n=1 Tax=Rhodonia placenta TaxID=104341 RepID=A0A8H7P5F2_9APHY|nr:hypothetical protein IEO21_03736 [Postia placenta]